MIILDTDTFSMVASGHPQVAAKFAKAAGEVTITVVTRIEALEGRFAFILRAADGANLLRAQEWLQRTERTLLCSPPYRSMMPLPTSSIDCGKTRNSRRSAGRTC